MTPLYIHCSKQVLPVEELAKAIFLLQTIEECDEECASLKKKLIACFDEIPDKEGRKQFRTARYYTNGLFELEDRSNVYNSLKLILEPWESKTIPKEPSLSKTEKYRYLRRFGILWTNQVREYLKLRYSILREDKIDINALKEKIAAIKALTKEEKKLLSLSDLKDRKCSLGDKMLSLFFTGRSICTNRPEHRGWHSKAEPRRAGWLTDEQVAYVAEMLTGNTPEKLFNERLYDLSKETAYHPEAFVYKGEEVPYYSIKLYNLLYCQAQAVTGKNCRRVLKRYGIL
jgi:hypothetical protein